MSCLALRGGIFETGTTEFANPSWLAHDQPKAPPAATCRKDRRDTFDAGPLTSVGKRVISAVLMKFQVFSSTDGRRLFAKFELQASALTTAIVRLPVQMHHISSRFKFANAQNGVGNIDLPRYPRIPLTRSVPVPSGFQIDPAREFSTSRIRADPDVLN